MAFLYIQEFHESERIYIVSPIYKSYRNVEYNAINVTNDVRNFHNENYKASKKNNRRHKNIRKNLPYLRIGTLIAKCLYYQKKFTDQCNRNQNIYVVFLRSRTKLCLSSTWKQDSWHY